MAYPPALNRLSSFFAASLEGDVYIDCMQDFDLTPYTSLVIFVSPSTQESRFSGSTTVHVADSPLGRHAYKTEQYDDRYSTTVSDSPPPYERRPRAFAFTEDASTARSLNALDLHISLPSEPLVHVISESKKRRVLNRRKQSKRGLLKWVQRRTRLLFKHHQGNSRTL